MVQQVTAKFTEPPEHTVPTCCERPRPVSPSRALGVALRLTAYSPSRQSLGNPLQDPARCMAKLRPEAVTALKAPRRSPVWSTLCLAGAVRLGEAHLATGELQVLQERQLRT